ncbi:FAD-dependent oxidoreductase [Stakelama tenebrarum]|uniref:FAD-dependent oxidoreductase n=1 Tax=Stakelama tenebrarum TaxID=2711215 RepID=A0A6G6Y787_9SPHN|nr:FAD-dependent oxidoreductase [Sphingosinithalassobacter tenebrarum]QIG80785.1 FAD-dependent oxidoreductase [Sphingosinithalassobacter tenebrarum]
MAETHDVIVVGSGAAGLSAALRARELGLDVLVVEKAHKIGGTSATSGGVAWIPNNGLNGTTDTREETLEYLDAVIQGPVNRARLEAYVDTGAEMLKFMGDQGINFIPMPWPDYFAEMPGSRMDRSCVLPMYDARKLGDKFPLVRDQYPRFKLFNRYAMNLEETFAIAARSKGWKRKFAKVISRYWMDRSTRAFTKRDRNFVSGNALIGPILEKLIEKGVEIRTETALEELTFTDGKVSGATVSQFGTKYDIEARHGVVIAAGGFEWSQELRDRFYPVKTSIFWSSTPPGANTGGALIAAEKHGAATEHTEEGWWAPTMILPAPSSSNFQEVHQAIFDVGRPGAVCVNRNGDRFVNESCSYDRFGAGMVADQKKTGANTPCWMVFDKAFRDKFTAGGILPTAIMSDKSIPVDWWDHYVFKADTPGELAKKLNLDPAKLEDVVKRMNDYAAKGEDPEFGRGSTIYDQAFGDPTCKPNPALGPIKKAPFYAIPVYLGDLGTKGGLKADDKARVCDGEGKPIPGLWAAGNAAGSPFGLNYPGAGGTIGPAMVFGYIAANDIASRASNRAPGEAEPATAE